MTDSLADAVDLEELPDGPIDAEVYRRLVELVEPDHATAAGQSGEFLPPDILPDQVWAFRFYLDDDGITCHYCTNCEQWEHRIRVADGTVPEGDADA